MANNLMQNVELPEREELYAQFTRVNQSAAESAETQETDEKQSIEAGLKRTTLIADFYNLVLLRRFWYYLLSLFTRKPAEMIFQQDQFQELRNQITRKNDKLIYYDREHKVHLLGSYLPEQFNPVFKLSLEVLPVINQVDRNRKFMRDIITKLIFHNYKNPSGQPLRTDATHFISEGELRSSIAMGDGAAREKINILMGEVSESCKNLPHSLYKHSVQIVRPLYQFQKICYFPFSNFFQTFRNQSRNDKNIYSNSPPKEAYESVSILYHLIQAVGKIEIDIEILHGIIDNYFHVAQRNESAKKSQKKADELIESFIKLQNAWNDFIQKIPIDYLLLFVAEDPYLDLPLVHHIDGEILEKLPQKMEKIYYRLVVNNIETMARDLRENLTQYYLGKYLPEIDTNQANYYYNIRKDLIPKPAPNKENIQDGPFHYCESFTYTLEFLSHFFSINIYKPLYALSISLFQPESKIYKEITNFLGETEKSRVKLGTINKNLKPDNRLDTEIKEIILRIERHSDGARDEYKSVIDNIDRQIRFLIEHVIREFKDFLVRDIPAMENLIQDDIFKDKFIALISQFQYMEDYNNPEYAPLTPETILTLWKRYISELVLLIGNQLEFERQESFGQEVS